MSALDGLSIGLMSGTSLDAIDVALVDVSKASVRLVATHTHPLTDDLRKDILALCQSGADEINRAGKLHLALGNAFADAVLGLLAQETLSPEKIIAIGSHGQTVRHRPDIGFSLQLGSADVIATRTGITTIADFRNHDMVLGGQGAPLVPVFHQTLFGKADEKRAIVNIGGMANASLLDGKELIAGFDTGPGNVLIDHWIKESAGTSYDDKGKFAASGSILADLMESCLADAYFQKQGPKSTGREHFNANWLTGKLKGTEKPEDVQATLTELTAVSIAGTLQEFAPDAAYVCGGGSKNDFLLRRLAIHLPDTTVATTDELGWPADWIEAACFAWLAWARLNHVPSTSPQVTGARHAAINGAVYLP
jgi:anhydro-N-acetylmuramic acid kinase